MLELVEKYISLKTGVRHNTAAGYKTVIGILKKEAFGRQRIDRVHLSDAKAWLIKLQQVDGKGYSSIHSIRGVLRPAFQMAVDDDLLRKNPFGFELASVVVNDSVTREAITRKQERDLLQFIKNDMPMVALHWEKYLQHIVEKYNRIYRIPMPKVTPHVCRHTFCSNMAKSGMNPKTLQYIMGHADIGVTLNTYTHVSYEDAKGELLRLAHA